MTLFHYCCEHVAPKIARDGFLKPGMAWRHYDFKMLSHGEPMSGLWRAPAVVWLTDLARPDRQALGLTSFTLPCDRTEVRFTVSDATGVVPWRDFAETHGAASDWLSVMEAGRSPEHWFVATNCLPICEQIRMAKVA